MTDTTHPKPSDIHKAMDLLQRVVAREKLPFLDMSEIEINHLGECGTIACHGGWYAYAKMRQEREGEYIPMKGPIYSLGFWIGANSLAVDLGFEDRQELEDWAHDNPEIWGNYFGHDIFVFTRAFGDDDDLTIHDIIDHWRNVADRIEDSQGNDTCYFTNLNKAAMPGWNSGPTTGTPPKPQS